MTSPTEDQHACTKENIDWNSNPSPVGDGDQIIWRGQCGVCGREVYELYQQLPELYDITTGEEIK